jgi:hypothetical protein
MRVPRELGSCVRIPVTVTAESCGDEVAGWANGSLAVHVVARPGYGLANAAVERLLAEMLGLPRRQVSVVGGHHAAEKLVQIDGLDDGDVERALPGRYASGASEQRRPARPSYI